MAKYNHISLAEVSFPSTSDVEVKVIAATANNIWMMNEVSGLVTADMFSRAYLPAWKSLCEMAENNEDVSMRSIARRVTDRRVSEQIIGAMAENPSPGDARKAAGELRRMVLRHRLYDNAVQVIQDVTKLDQSEEDLLAVAHSFEDTSITGLVPRKDETLSDVFKDLSDALESYQITGKAARITSGFGQVDTRIQGGYAPGQLVILAARPSVGKTAFMLQMAIGAAKTGEPAIIYSLEMTKRELAERMVIGAGGLSAAEVTTGQVEWNRYNDVVAKLERLPITIDDRSRSLQEIVSSLTLRVKHGHIRIAYIDYLGYVNNPEEGSSVPLFQRIATITATLKATARKLEIPVVLLCQLNRETAKGDRAPELYDLRDSGSIEQDADIVLMLQRFDPVDEDAPVEIAMHIRKNRRGRNNVELRFLADPTYTTFAELGEIRRAD